MQCNASSNAVERNHADFTEQQLSALQHEHEGNRSTTTREYTPKVGAAGAAGATGVAIGAAGADPVVAANSRGFQFTLRPFFSTTPMPVKQEQSGNRK